MFRIGDLIVDKRPNPTTAFGTEWGNLGVGLITEKKELVDGTIQYGIDFPLLRNISKWFEKELITNIGIGSFEHYPVKKLY